MERNLRLITPVLKHSSQPPSKPLDRYSKLVIAVVASVWLLAMLGGGSARADVIYVAPLRVAAFAGAAGILIALPRERMRFAVAPLAFLGLVAAAIALQLVPLPHGIWAALPGRAAYDDLRDVSDIGSLWRPISLAPDLTWNALVALAPALFFVVAVPLLERRARDWLLIGLLVTIMASAVLGLLQLAGGPTSDLRWYHLTNETSAVGLFANRNHEAVFLAAGIPILAWWALRAKEPAWFRGRVAVAAAGTLFLLVAVATSQSRMGLVVAGISVILSAAYLLRRIRLPARSLPLVGAALLVMGGLTAVGLSHWSANRLSVSGVEDDLRVRIFPETLVAARTYFPLGSGYGTFPEVFRRFESVEDLDEFYVNHTHTEPTQLLIEGGVVSILLLLLFIAWYFPAAARVWRRGAGPSAEEGRLASLLVLLPLLGSLTDYPVRAPLMTCMLAMAATLLHMSRRAESAS